MYRRHFKADIGFHGCDLETAKKIICDRHTFKPSDNEYDWLGPGVYFWENSPERARAFAFEQMGRATKVRASRSFPYRNVGIPAVIGAVLDLGLCLDLTNQTCLEEMKAGYERLKHSMQVAGLKMPINDGTTLAGDKWNRQLDCAVINMVHEMRRQARHAPYESVRSPFYEGNKLFPGTEFTEKAHVQIAIRNPNCIKGTFWPRERVPWPRVARARRGKTSAARKK
jgi:hypothetical protein